MKVVLTLLVRDEEDLIKLHLDHHLSLGIDHIVVTDNLSVDGTVDILREYAKLPTITVWRETDDNYAQAKWVTKMARYAQDELGADWVVHSDCDEFLMPWADLSLKEALQGYSSGVEVLNIYRHDFVPVQDFSGNPLHEMIYRKTYSTNIFDNVLPPKIIHRNIAQVNIGQGNHEVTFPSNITTLDCNEIEIYHYPIRTYDQFENKIKKGGQAYENNQELGPNVGSTWRYLYEQFKIGSLKIEYDKLCYSKTRIDQALSTGELIVADDLAKRFSL